MNTYIKNQLAEHKKFWSDCKHIFWLFRQMIKAYISGDKDGVLECKTFIWMHWNYKSKRIN